MFEAVIEISNGVGIIVVQLILLNVVFEIGGGLSAWIKGRHRKG